MEETGDINQTLGGEAADQNGSSLWTICTLRFKLSLDHQQQQRSVSWEHFEHLLLKCRGARPLFNFHWAAAFFKGFTGQRRLQKKKKKFNPRFYRSLQLLSFNELWVASTMSNLSIEAVYDWWMVMLWEKVLLSFLFLLYPENHSLIN